MRNMLTAFGHDVALGLGLQNSGLRGCDMCRRGPLAGVRFVCQDCSDHVICTACHISGAALAIWPDGGHNFQEQCVATPNGMHSTPNGMHSSAQRARGPLGTSVGVFGQGGIPPGELHSAGHDGASAVRRGAKALVYAAAAAAAAAAVSASSSSISGSLDRFLRDAELDSLPLPSLGSIAHGFGTCQPCHYAYSKVGCRLDKKCGLCHYRHPKRRKRRPMVSTDAQKSSASSEDGDFDGYNIITETITL